MSIERVPATAPPPAAGPRFTLARAFLAGIGIAVVAAAVSPVEDPDFWWHLRTGQWIWDHGGVPHLDLYTHTVTSHVWVAHEWLSELLLAGIFWLGRLPAVSIGLGLVTLAGYYWIFRRIDGGRVGFLAAGLALALGVFAGGPIWGPRVQMITFALTALLLLWIRQFCEGRGRALYAFPLVALLWANLHAGFFIAYVFLGLTLALELVRARLGAQGALSARQLRRLAIIGAASVAAAIFNPNTYQIYLYAFQTQASRAQQSLIVEWFSPDFHRPELRAFEGMLFAIIVLLPLARRVPVREFFYCLITLGLAFQSVRHISFFVVGSTPLLALLLQEAWARANAVRGRPWHWIEPAFRGAGILNAALVAAVAVLVLGVTAARVLPRQVDGQAMRKTYPVAAADFIQRTDPPGRMFNQYGWGGYLVWRLYPRYPVFIYGDGALMGDAFLREYEHVEILRPDFLDILNKYQVDWVIFPSQGVVVTALRQSPEWAAVYRDSTAAIVMRRTLKTSAYLDAHALP